MSPAPKFASTPSCRVPVQSRMMDALDQQVRNGAGSLRRSGAGDCAVPRILLMWWPSPRARRRISTDGVRSWMSVDDRAVVRVLSHWGLERKRARGDSEGFAIVTGGLSEIGAAVVAAIGLRRHRIVVAADISTPSTEFEPIPGVHPLRVDVTDQDSVCNAVRGPRRDHRPAAASIVWSTAPASAASCRFWKPRWKHSSWLSGRIWSEPSSSGRPVPT